MVNYLIEEFKSKKNCITFEPADTPSIDYVNALLLQQNFSPLPDEFVDFLKTTNGMIYNGIEFFGTTYHYRDEKDYYFPDLLTINKHYKKYDFFKSKVIFGRLSESILIYDRKSNYYAIVDRVKLRSRIEVETFEELLKTLSEYCEY